MTKSAKTPRFQLRLQTCARRLYHEAGEDVALRFYTAVEDTCQLIAQNPHIGMTARFRSHELARYTDLRFHPVLRPFQNWLIYYRFNGENVILVSVVHGSRAHATAT